MKELEARIKRLEDKSPQSSSETTDTDEEDDELGMLSAQWGLIRMRICVKRTLAILLTVTIATMDRYPEELKILKWIVDAEEFLNDHVPLFNDENCI